jgi:hypothetical protein
VDVAVANAISLDRRLVPTLVADEVDGGAPLTQTFGVVVMAIPFAVSLDRRSGLTRRPAPIAAPLSMGASRGAVERPIHHSRRTYQPSVRPSFGLTSFGSNYGALG